MSTKDTKTFKITDGESIALDFRAQQFPFGYSVRIGSGGTVTREASNAGQPGGKYVAPPANGTITTSMLFSEEQPVAWIKFDASGADCFVDFVGSDVETAIVEHDSDLKVVAVKSPAYTNPGLKVGQRSIVNIHDIFDYPRGALSLVITSSDDTKLTAAPLASGNLDLEAVAAGSATISIQATDPTGHEASASFSVTVSA